MTLPAIAALPDLPHWEQPPADIPAAIREVKAALRARIAASGRTIEQVFAVMEARVAAEVEDVVATREHGGTVWPVIDYANIEAGTVPAEMQSLLRRRGCLVVRGHFDRDEALDWDRGIVDYVDSNHFFEQYRGPGDDFFRSVASKPEIYPVYWSPAQMKARQHDRMARVQGYLNRLWKYESDGVQWFDPGRNLLYPDRIRRRPPGADSAGLGAHLDAGTLDLWLTQGYQKAFRNLFDGSVERYDPWDAAYRTTAAPYPGSTMCSAFRTFQGWTAMSDMAHDQGVLHTVPIPAAMAYLLLRPLLHDVPDEDMCAVSISQAFPASKKWHDLPLQALTGIPDVNAGDSVWWHCDMIHSVAPVTNQQGWGNVMYIPAAPWSARNEQYAPSVRDAFLSGNSPSDFPGEHYERTWQNRFQAQDLNETGRRGLGLN